MIYQLSVILGALLSVSSGASLAGSTKDSVKGFQQIASAHTEAVGDLKDAILAGDLDEAKEQYATAKAIYNKLSVLGGSVPEIHSDINARPWVFDNGEARKGLKAGDLDEPGTNFQGYHFIEAKLFRDEDVDGAAADARRLVRSSRKLETALKDMSNFDAETTFKSAIAVAFEIGARKMSSEEEVWSDLSTLVFYNNIVGVQSAVGPFMEQIKNPAIKLEVQSAFASSFGAVLPYVYQNEDGETQYVPYSALSTSERDGIQKAAYALAGSLSRFANDLGLDVSAAEEEEEECEENEAATAIFNGKSKQTKDGTSYFSALMPAQIKSARALVRAIESGDLMAAKKAYAKSRPFYEQIEVLAGSFEELDSDIDARPYGFPLGEYDEGFKGFHRVERYLYRDMSTGPATIAAAEGLVDSLIALEKALKEPERFDGVSTFEGTLGLATEVVAKKVSSEEEAWSDLSVIIFYNNYKGIWSQMKPFGSIAKASTMNKIASAIIATVDCLKVDTKDNIDEVSASDVDATFLKNLEDADYGLYSQLSIDDRKCVVDNGNKVRDAIVELAEEVGVLSDCSPFHKSSVFKYGGMST